MGGLSVNPPPPAQAGSAPRRIPPGTVEIALPNHIVKLRGSAHAFDGTSPVNANGSFDFDRIIKDGSVLKRTKKTKSWKPIRVVLRPHAVSLYKDPEDTQLRHQISLTDITAVARQKDPKGKAQHVFGIFSPARNFHFSANSDEEAQEWVEVIRTHARIDEEEEELVLKSPGGANPNTFQGFQRPQRELLSSSSEAEPSTFGRFPSSAARHTNQGARQPSYTQNYSGNESGPYSDFSDTAPVGSLTSNLSLPARNSISQGRDAPPIVRTSTNTRRNDATDEERVVCNGWLLLLKSRGGVRQWKKIWAVLRPKGLAFYKGEDEYSANMIIPFHNIIDAVDIENVSKSKKHCMQILTEERNYRFCAPDEDTLANWLGAIKSLLSKRRESQKELAALKAAQAQK